MRSPLSPEKGAPCGPGISLCDGVCTDTRFDPSNCGRCGTACSADAVCDQGSCRAVGSSGAGGRASGTGGSSGFAGVSGSTSPGATAGRGGSTTRGAGGSSGTGCSYPKQMCGIACVNASSDIANCGYCGSRCAAGETCSKSKCVQGCGAALASCSDTCVNLQTDPANCGSCGHVCDGTMACNGGQCGAPCPEGTGFCDGTCSTLSQDNANCGACGVTCSNGDRCSAGVCRGTMSMWPTLGGDVHHSGYNPTETGKPPLTKAFSVNNGKGSLWPAVSDGKTIYVSSSNYFGANQLWALAPDDGHTLWNYNFGDIFSVGQPTVDSGHVYVAQCNEGSTFMYSFVAADGKILWSQPFGSQWEHYWAPLVVGGRVYFDGGGYGGLYGLDQASGTQLFFASEAQWDEWSPLYLDNYVYVFTDGNLYMHDPASGTVVRSAMVAWIWNGYSMNTSPVSDGASIYIISPPNLISFGPNLGSPRWTANGAYQNQPAVADGVVYAISGGQLRANDAATGTVLWTFAADSALKYPPVVAAGHVYVASDASVFAVELATQDQVWKDTPGGWLSIARGQLLVAAQDGTLVAWSLAQ